MLRFGDPKNISTYALKIRNINDDTHEIYIGAQAMDFPLGWDWSIYRWFIDQIRFTDPGAIMIHLKFYRNQSDTKGVDEGASVGQRYVIHGFEINYFYF